MTYEELKDGKNVLADIIAEIEAIIRDSANYHLDFSENGNQMKETKFAEYQHQESVVERVLYEDRRHPADSVIINTFNQKTGSEIQKAEIVYGPAADEFTRSQHALAIAVADRIYFRNGAYKPETEEGRKLLTHELTHVSQHKNKEDYRTLSKDDLENEAEQNELLEQFESDPFISKKINGKEYTLKKSEWKKIYSEAFKKLSEKIENAEQSMSGEDYLKLLINYEKFGEEKDRLWQQ